MQFMHGAIIVMQRLKDMFHDWYIHPEYNHNDNGAFHQHMPTMRLLSKGLRVVEFGARHGTSTLAIATGMPASFISIDIEIKDTVRTIQAIALDCGIDMTVLEHNDLEIEIPECDLLFIDTLHTYSQLKQELALHGNKAQKYIVMHDIVSFGHSNEDGSAEGPGLLPAIIEFLGNNPHWQVEAYYYNNNGLMILSRTC